MLPALSKVTWPHLLLACSEHSARRCRTTFNSQRKGKVRRGKERTGRILTIMHGVPRCDVFKDTSARSLFRCLSRTMSEIRAAAASSIHAARSRSHSARYQTHCGRHGNRATSANQNPSPPISPGNCRSAGAARARTPPQFASYGVFSLLPTAALVNVGPTDMAGDQLLLLFFVFVVVFVVVLFHVAWNELIRACDRDRAGRVPRYLGYANTLGRREGMCHHTQTRDDSAPWAGPLPEHTIMKGSNVICVNFVGTDTCRIMPGYEGTKRAKYSFEHRGVISLYNAVFLFSLIGSQGVTCCLRRWIWALLTSQQTVTFTCWWYFYSLQPIYFRSIHEKLSVVSADSLFICFDREDLDPNTCHVYVPRTLLP